MTTSKSTMWPAMWRKTSSPVRSPNSVRAACTRPKMMNTAAASPTVRAMPPNNDVRGAPSSRDSSIAVNAPISQVKRTSTRSIGENTVPNPSGRTVKAFQKMSKAPVAPNWLTT